VTKANKPAGLGWNDWLARSLGSALAEVGGWPDWKKEAMRVLPEPDIGGCQDCYTHIEVLKAVIERLTREHDRLRVSRKESVLAITADRDDVRAEVERLTAERDALRAVVEAGASDGCWCEPDPRYGLGPCVGCICRAALGEEQET
jgi:hypothetical protein